eukprot:5375569-Amphidinium_carterae.1
MLHLHGGNQRDQVTQSDFAHVGSGDPRVAKSLLGGSNLNPQRNPGQVPETLPLKSPNLTSA